MNELPPNLWNDVVAATRRQPSPTRAEHARRRRAALVVGGLCVLAVAFMRGIPNASGGRPGLFVGIAAGTAGIAALAGSLWVLSADASPLGRPRWTLRAMAWALPTLLAVGALGANLSHPDTLSAPRASMDAALTCLGLFALLAALLLALAVWLERRSDPVAPRATGAGFGALAGAWAAFAMTLQCPAVDPVHVLATHIAPTAIFIAAGVVAGVRWLALGSER